MADNLLDKASILLTPTAYNDGSMLSVKPENGDGDFDFSRSSAATRVNAQGLVENVQIISPELVSNGNFSQIGTEEVLNGNFSQEGSELVTNGDFATDSDWSKVNATISDGKGNLDGDGQTSILWQDILTNGSSYKATFTVLDYNGLGDAKVINNDGISIFNITSNGTFTIYFQHSIASGNILFRAVSGAVFSIDNVSVKEVGQNWAIENTWTIGDGVANGNGANGITEELVQLLNFDSSKKYEISYQILNYVSGSVRYSLSGGGGYNGQNKSANGTYVDFINTGASHTQIKFFGLNFIGSITNISVKEVGQDWTFGAGWSVDQANSKAVSDGTSSFSSLYQNTSLSIGTKCIVKFDAVVNSGNLQGIGFEPFNQIEITSSGNYEFITETRLNKFEFRTNSLFDGSITNISVKEITDDTDLPRINYSGFSYQDSLGSEEIVNGDFSNGSANWSFSSGATLTDIGAKITHAPTAGSIGQSNILTIGKQYKLTYEITESISGGLKFNSAVDSSMVTSVGVHTKYFEADGTTAGFSRTNASNNDVTITNISVKEYFGQEVVPDSGCGNWLLEPQSTNLVTYSEDFSQWSNVSTTLTSSYLAPDGTLGATKISGTIGTSYIALSSTSSQTATRTIWARTVSGTGTAKLMSYYQNTNNLFTLTEKWQRFELNGAIATGGTSFYVDFRDNSQTLNEFIIWGAQSEALSYATSYIPTNGATNTRLQDVATNSGNASLINSTEGVLYAEIAALANDGLIRRLCLSNGTSSQKVLITFSATANRIQFEVINSTNQFYKEYVSSDLLDFHKVAIKYKQNDFSIYVNGSKIHSTTSGNAPIGLSKLSFDNGTGSQNFYGKTKALAVYKEALTDAELQSLTTI